MDSMAGPVEPGLGPSDSPNLRVVKETYVAYEEGGVEAAIEHLLEHSHPDVVFTPFVGRDMVLRGRDEVRSYYLGQIQSGTSMAPRTSSFEERGDEIVVNGSLRVERPTGGFAESQISWTYRFRDGLLVEARWGPRGAA
jgi:ketosteroid isomerase-like protein